MSSRDQRRREQRENDRDSDKYYEIDRKGRSKKSHDPSIPFKRAPSTDPERPKKPVIPANNIPQKVPATDINFTKPPKSPPPPTPPPPPSAETASAFQSSASSATVDSALSGEIYALDKTQWRTQLDCSQDQDLTMMHENTENVHIKVNGRAMTAAFTSSSEESFISGDFAKKLKIKAKAAKSPRTYLDLYGEERQAHMRIKTHIEFGGKKIDSQYLYLIFGTVEQPVIIGNKLKSQLLFQDSSMPYSDSTSQKLYPEAYTGLNNDLSPSAQQPFPRMSDLAGSLPRQADYHPSSRYSEEHNMGYNTFQQPKFQLTPESFQGMGPESIDSTSDQQDILSYRPKSDSIGESNI